MREIKFRGRRVDNGEWVYGFYNYIGVTSKDRVTMEMAHVILTMANEDPESLIQNVVLKETVGQYTGLKDKNGVEIYEGDIVSVVIYSYVEPLLGGNFEVVYSENRACLVFKHLDGNICYSSLDELTDINDFYAYEIEVIVNIHEVSNETTM